MWSTIPAAAKSAELMPWRAASSAACAASRRSRSRPRGRAAPARRAARPGHGRPGAGPARHRRFPGRAGPRSSAPHAPLRRPQRRGAMRQIGAVLARQHARAAADTGNREDQAVLAERGDIGGGRPDQVGRPRPVAAASTQHRLPSRRLRCRSRRRNRNRNRNRARASSAA
jgi:hypothetical protein